MTETPALPEWVKPGTTVYLFKGGGLEPQPAKVTRVTGKTAHVTTEQRPDVVRKFRQAKWGADLIEWGSRTYGHVYLVSADSPKVKNAELNQARAARWQPVNEASVGMVMNFPADDYLPLWEAYAHALVEYLGKERSLRALEAGQE